MFMSFALHLPRIKMYRKLTNAIKIKTSRARDVNYRPSAAPQRHFLRGNVTFHAQEVCFLITTVRRKS